MKKKYVGVSYESNDGAWRIEREDDGNTFYVIDNLENKPLLKLTLGQLLELSELFSDILVDVGAKETIQISSPGNSFVSTVTPPVIDMRFHPDPDGLLSL